MTSATTWVTLENLTLGERRWAQKATDGGLPLVGNILNRSLHRDRKHTCGCPELAQGEGFGEMEPFEK